MFNVSQFAEVHQANLEKSLRVSQIALNGVERLLNLQVSLARDLLSEQAQTAKALAEVKDAQGLATLQKQLAQPAVDKALDTARSVFDVASATQHELTKLVEEQVLGFNKQLIASLDRAAELAPAGSGAAVTMLRNAAETAASTLDAVAKNTQKVTEELVQAAVANTEKVVKTARSKTTA
ncbi:phasin family protein [Chitinibacteraceae bacterium HSL-7]